MFALTMVVCVWLTYNVWQYHAEQTVVAHARLLDPQAEAVWTWPQWWQTIFGQKSAGVLDRIQILTLHGEQLDISQVAELEFDRLTAFENLEFANTEIWDEDAEELQAKFGGHFQVRFVTEDRVLRSISANRSLRRFMLEYSRGDARFGGIPEELTYCRVGTSHDEDQLLQWLKQDDEELAALAARTLWRMHSLIYAKHVIEFTKNLQPKNDHAKRVKADITASCRTENLLKELEMGSVEWASWLAALHPHPTLTQSMIRAVDTGRATIETIYALGKSKDPQVVPTLIKALSDPKLGSEKVAIRALIPYAGESLEQQLIVGLEDGNDLFVANAAEVLGKTGTTRALSALLRLKDNSEFANAPVEVATHLRLAIEAIEVRTRETGDASAKKEQ